MRWPRPALLLACLSILLLSACGTGQAPQAPAPSQTAAPAAPSESPQAQSAAAQPPLKPLPIAVAYPVLGSGAIPLWLAEHAGLYQKYGLDAKLMYIAGGSKAVQALLADSVDVITNGGPAISANLEGADLVFIAAPSNKFEFALVSQPEINSVQELKGKKIGLTRLGSGGHFALKFVLSENGINEKEVNLMQTGGMPETIAALAAKQLQAGILSAPNIQKAEAMGFKILLDLKQLRQKYVQGALATRKKFIRQNPEVLRRFIKAYVESLYLFKSDRQLAERVIAKYARISDPKISALAYDYFSSATHAPPYIDLDAIRTVMQELREEGRKVTLQAEEMVDMSFLDELQRSGFFAEMEKAHPKKG